MKHFSTLAFAGITSLAQPMGSAASPASLLLQQAGSQEASSSTPGVEPRPRSVLFYLMDTTRGDRMQFDGYARKTTPFLSWLAERSVVFEDCYSQASWTKPSMASMLSSQYPSSTGVYRMEHRLPEEIVTWPELLQASGIYTAGFSANIVMGNSLSGLAQGFDHFIESTLINRADPIRFASGSAKKLNEHAFSWLDSTDHWPMLLYLHSVDPHEEYEPEPRYLERFADPKRHAQFRTEWSQLLKSRPPIPGLYVTEDNFARTGIDAGSFIEHASNLYDADILANDDELQRLWDKLKQDGWGEDFILVFTSDHGDEFLEHGGTSHGYSLYDEMIRIPLMIYAPGLLPAGKRIAAPVRSLDIFPTLCELLGIATPEGLAGESLLPLVHAKEAQLPREAFSEHREDPVLRRIGQAPGMLVSLRSGRWKFILNQTSSQLIPKPRFELFDLELDPGEKRNVADAHPELVKQFEAKTMGFIAAHWQPESKGPVAEMAPEVLDELRALGYMGDDEDEDDEQAAPDLWEALDAGDLQLIKALLAAGANVNQLDPLFGLHPLSMAALRGNLKLAKLLVEAGAQANSHNQDGSTPLSGAAFLGRIEVLEYLLDQGADPSAKDPNGSDALSATMTPWDTTLYIANLINVAVEQKEVLEGRQQCAELLRLSME